MKRLLSSISITLAISLAAAAPISIITAINHAHAAEETGLYYNFGDQKISLSLRQDTIAVVMKKPRRGTKTPLALLRDDFSDTPTRSTRGGAKSSSTTQVQALGGRYAVLTATNDAKGAEKLKEKAESKPYIEATLPVLKIAGKSTSLVLPNEIIVSFQPNVSSAEQASILASNNLGEVKEIPFATGFYTVVPRSAKGLEVLNISNRLSKVKGVESSMPSFIEIKSAPTGNIFSTNETGSPKKISSKSSPEQDLKTLQWHINSQPMIKSMGLVNGRTDVRAPEAWNRGKKGDGVLVAVIDNLIQWDHPALTNSIATVNCSTQKVACLPKENHGWDFSNTETDGDNDTRINAEELDSLRPEVQESLKSDEYLQTKYAAGIARYKAKKPQISDAQVLLSLRDSLRGNAIASFHGTMSTGMIVGSANNGFQGIAPNVKILPVRAGGLGGSLSMRSVLMSMAYSAIRGADVINMSFGSDTPSPAEAKMLARLQAEYPKLVFVAAAGNENTPNPAYPASYPGIISVGAINIKGNRASYSNYGQRINVVAPGGDPDVDGGVLTLSGVGANGFWVGATQPTAGFAPFQDNRGYYVFTEGTSFASPAVVGVVALMKSADPKRKLTAAQYGEILASTSSRESLSLTAAEKAIAAKESTNGEQFFFGNGLVNAEKAVIVVEKMQR